MLHLPRGSTRTATLLPRRWQDLLPRWAVGLHVGLTVLAVGLAVVEFMVRPWVDEVLGRDQGGVDPWRRVELAEPSAGTSWRPRWSACWPSMPWCGVRAAVGIGMWLAGFLDTVAMSRFLTIVRQDPESAPGWLQVAVLGWSAVTAAPRRREAGVSA